MTIDSAINYLNAKGLKPNVRKFGEAPSVVVKMTGNYTFTIREHETKPNLVYANLKNGDVLVEWAELDASALPLAWEHAQRYVYPNNKALQSKKSEIMLWGTATAVLMIAGVISYITLQKVYNCDPQQVNSVQE